MSKSAAVSETQILNRVIVDVIQDSYQQCAASSSSSQSMTFSGLDLEGCDLEISDINQIADIQVNTMCLQASSQDTDLQTKFEQKLDEAIEAQTGGILSGVASTAAITKTGNAIKKSVSMTSVAQCMATSYQTQNQTFGDIKMKCYPGQKLTFKNVTQLLISNTVADCIQSNDQLATLSIRLDEEIKKHAKAVADNTTLLAVSSGALVSIVSVILSIIIAIKSR